MSHKLPSQSCDADALRHRIALLEDASSKAWSERDSMESRIAALEREHASAIRASEHAFEGNACRLTELAMSVAELPRGPVMRAALEQLSWLDEEDSGQKLRLQSLFNSLESRLANLEQCVRSAEDSIAGAEVGTTSCDPHAQFAQSLCARFCELKALCDTKADCKELDRFGQALNQSCRDLTSTLKVHQQNLTQIEQKCSSLGCSIEQNCQDVVDLRDVLAKRDEDLFELERQWSKRLWGYSELNSSSRRARPQSARGAKQAEVTNAQPWKPWSRVSAPFQPKPNVQLPNACESDCAASLAQTQRKSLGKNCQGSSTSEVERLASRIWESGPERMGAPALSHLRCTYENNS